jgi:hypothetical protein
MERVWTDLGERAHIEEALPSRPLETPARGPAGTLAGPESYTLVLVAATNGRGSTSLVRGGGEGGGAGSQAACGCCGLRDETRRPGAGSVGAVGCDGPRGSAYELDEADDASSASSSGLPARVL